MNPDLPVRTCDRREFGFHSIFSPETAVGVHGFSVFLSWQFHYDKTGVFLPPDRCSFETCFE